jgi:hypothetical protein
MPTASRRRHLLISLLSTTLLLGTASSSPSPLSLADEALFDAALKPLNLSSSDLTLPQNSIGLWGGDKYKLKMMDFLRGDVMRCGPYACSTSAGLLTNAGNLGNLATSAHSRLDSGIRLGLVGDPLAAYRKRVEDLGPDCLAVALAELTGEQPENYSGDVLYLQVPLPVRKAAALLLFTVPEAQRDRRQGLVEPMLKLAIDPQSASERVLQFSVNTFEEEDDTTGHEVIDDRAEAALVESLMDTVDWDYLNRSSTLLAIATQEAHKLLLPPQPAADPSVEPEDLPPAGAEAAQHQADQRFMDLLNTTYSFEAETPLGVVRLSGRGRDEFLRGPYLLSIDTGTGDDVYGSAGAAGFDYPVSISIDRAGNDLYVGGERGIGGEVACGLFGTGIMLDAAGDDLYQCGYAGQGAGIFGTGVLYDLGGNDHYESFGYSQGSGTFGAGILAELGGDDIYTTYKYGQAYGGTRGCGILLDVDGNDLYLANMTDHFNGGLYGPTHHVHFVQGSAYGRRADITDGHSWAGGFGLLCDGAGDDRYVADCYGQGNAYWHCCGMLVDKGGNDVYRAGQYSQASAPHFACGILQDDGGDDRYVISIRQSMAHGRDWSIAWLEDSAGNDWYQGARTTLGVSHVNSISVFWDKLGADTYIMKGPGLGDSEPEPNGSVRDWLLTLGLFLDGGGHDGYYLLPGDESYEGSNTFSGEITTEDLPTLGPLDFAGDGKVWQRTVTPETAPGYKGSGVDR